MAISLNDITRGLPKHIINDIVKSAVPTGVHVSSEAITAINASATYYVLSVAAKAAVVHKSKHLTPEMIIATIKLMGFPSFEPLLREQLTKLPPKTKSKANRVSKKEIKTKTSPQQKSSLNGCESHVKSEDNPKVDTKDI